MKKEPLVIGQTVWLESRSALSNEPSVKLRKMAVREANKSSAYIWYDGEGSNRETKSRIRVSQKTHEVHSFFFGYHERIWLSEEDYHAHIEFVAKKREVREYVETFVTSSSRTYNELASIKEFIQSL